jgi:hypothetical protein
MKMGGVVTGELTSFDHFGGCFDACLMTLSEDEWIRNE